MSQFCSFASGIIYLIVGLGLCSFFFSFSLLIFPTPKLLHARYDALCLQTSPLDSLGTLMLWGRRRHLRSWNVANVIVDIDSIAAQHTPNLQILDLSVNLADVLRMIQPLVDRLLVELVGAVSY